MEQVISLIRQVTGPTGGWLISPADFGNQIVQTLYNREADSREPEKLNNAQRFAYIDDSSGTTFILRLGTHDVIIGWRGKDGYKDIADIKAAFDSVALAESSLSSPPPKEEEK